MSGEESLIHSRIYKRIAGAETRYFPRNGVVKSKMRYLAWYQQEMLMSLVSGSLFVPFHVRVKAETLYKMSYTSISRPTA